MDKILAGISALARYGYIVDTIACDGTSENRSALKTLATIKAKDFLASKISNLDGGDDIMKKIPMDTYIAFWHPIFPDIPIFLAQTCRIL